MRGRGRGRGQLASAFEPEGARPFDAKAVALNGGMTSTVFAESPKRGERREFPSPLLLHGRD